MKKIVAFLICFTLCIANLSFFPVAVHAAQTTATFNGLSFPDAQAVDKSTPIDGFLFEGSTGLGVHYYQEYGEGNTGCVVASSTGPTNQTLSIKREGSIDFKLVSLYLDDSDEFGSQMCRIDGYLDGSLVDGCTIENVDVYTAHTETINWGRIDEFRITATSMASGSGAYDVAPWIDNIVYDDPVDPNTAPSIVTKIALTVDEGAAGSLKSKLVSTDAEQEDGTLTYILTSSPSNGQLENTDNAGVSISSFTQQNLTDGKIQYVHDGSNTTSDSFTFKVSDGIDELTGQTFNITINSVDDDAPSLIRNNALTLNEGAMASITATSHLSATDGDSNDATLTYTVTSSPSNGKVENTDNPGVSINSFTQQNLTDGKIEYVHDDTNTTSDSFVFKVSDGVPNELTGQTFNITVNAVDDDTPTIVTNELLTLDEGATAGITFDSHLEANDSDSDNAILTYTITSSQSNGQVENTDNPGVSINSFTQQDLIDGKIQYVHDGTNTTSDSFVFKVSDGVPNELTLQTFNITVNAVDDDAPTIVTNAALELDEGATASITESANLSATDADSNDSTLTYIVTSIPSNGQVRSMDNPLVPVTSFTQQDLIDGKIRYIHNGSNTTSDSFGFKVSDGTNELTGQMFCITVYPVDDDKPTIVRNNVLTLDEGATASITPLSHLLATDTDSDDSTLTYTVTTSLSRGRLENSDSPGVAISTFSQQNLVDGKIQYVHDGSNTTSDSFVFKVSDGTNELINQTLNISVNAVNDDAPTIVRNNGLSLYEGDTSTITTSSHLSATDADSNDATLMYIVTSSPINGRLGNSDNPGVSITTFTQQNLLDGKIQYVHDGSNTTSDSFTFNVSDGTNELIGQTFDFSISEFVPTPTPTSTPTTTPTATTTSTSAPITTPASTKTPSNDSRTITGVLTDSDGNPMVGYIVELHSDPITVITDSEGKYTFSNVEFKEHKLIVKTPEGEEIETFYLDFSQGETFDSTISGTDVNIIYTTNTVSIEVVVSIGNDNSAQIDDINAIENPKTGDGGVWWKWAVSVIIALIALAACLMKKYEYPVKE